MSRGDLDRADEGLSAMAKLSHEITPSGGTWTIFRNAKGRIGYATVESAFEVANLQTSIEMRSENEVVIHVTPTRKR